MFKSKTWHVYECGRELQLLLKINQAKLKAKIVGVLFPKKFDILLLNSDVPVCDDRIYMSSNITMVMETVCENHFYK